LESAKRGTAAGRLRDAADAPPGEPARPAGGFRERRRLSLL